MSWLSSPFIIRVLTIHYSLSILCFAWGAVASCMAAVQTWNQLAGVRFCLGVAEAGFAPGIAFYLSSWYKRHELAKRYSIYYTATAVSVSHGPSSCVTAIELFIYHRVLSQVSSLVSSQTTSDLLVALRAGDGCS